MREGSVDPGYFVSLYRAKSDPWHFATSAYERDKYAASLGVLQSRYSAALEVACSIGVVTRKLSRRCERLLALDPSPDALERARARCGHLRHVAFACGAGRRTWTGMR